MHRTQRYLNYLKSPAWKKKRKLAIYYANNRCARCNWQSPDGKGLEVHHKTYDNLGSEPLSDLEVLCEKCHVAADAGRRQRQRSNFYEARLDGWASKVYGDNWRVTQNEEDVEDAFDEWLDRQDL